MTKRILTEEKKPYTFHSEYKKQLANIKRQHTRKINKVKRAQAKSLDEVSKMIEEIKRLRNAS